MAAFALFITEEWLIWEGSGDVFSNLQLIDLISRLGSDSVIQLFASLEVHWVVCLLLGQEEPVLRIDADQHVVAILLFGAIAVRKRPHLLHLTQSSGISHLVHIS